MAAVDTVARISEKRCKDGLDRFSSSKATTTSFVGCSHSPKHKNYASYYRPDRQRFERACMRAQRSAAKLDSPVG